MRTVQTERDDLPAIMSTEQVLAFLGIHEKVLRRLRREGRISLYESNPLKMREWRNRYAREDVLRLKEDAERQARQQQQRAS